MIIEKKVIQYKRARWKLKNGKYYTEKMPAEHKGTSFGPGLRQHIVYQQSANRVTQGKIYQELQDKGFDVSVGQINAILAEAANNLYNEKEAILEAAIKTKKPFASDDTGGRHNGKNCISTVIRNDFFTYFKTTDSKSRINFLNLLKCNKGYYIINNQALAYAEIQGLGKEATEWLTKKIGMQFEDYEKFKQFVHADILAAHARKTIIEAGTLAGCIDNGLSPEQILLTDGAGQFKILKHALCWIHAERAIKKLISIDDDEKKSIDFIRGLIWDYYDQLKEYKKNPSEEQKNYLSKKFDTIFSTLTHGYQLAPILAKFLKQKKELLLVLEHPDIPLHNNGSEQDIRDYVIRRKISGGTRSSAGRDARDTFTSLSKTCLKNGISFWNFLNDRIRKINDISQLSDVVLQRTLGPSP